MDVFVDEMEKNYSLVFGSARARRDAFMACSPSGKCTTERAAFDEATARLAKTPGFLFQMGNELCLDGLGSLVWLQVNGLWRVSPETWRVRRNLTGCLWESYLGNLGGDPNIVTWPNCSLLETCYIQNTWLETVIASVRAAVKEIQTRFKNEFGYSQIDPTLFNELDQKAHDLTYAIQFFYFPAPISISALAIGGFVFWISFLLLFGWYELKLSLQKQKFLYMLFCMSIYGLLRITWGVVGMAGTQQVSEVFVQILQRLVFVVNTVSCAVFLYLWVATVHDFVFGVDLRLKLGVPLFIICSIIIVYSFVEATLHAIWFAVQNPKPFPEFAMFFNDVVQFAFSSVFVVYAGLLLRKLREMDQYSFKSLDATWKSSLIMFVLMSIVFLAFFCRLVVQWWYLASIGWHVRLGDSPYETGGPNFFAELTFMVVVSIVVAGQMFSSYGIVERRQTMSEPVPFERMSLDQETPLQYQV